jgi:hypothetical protein
VYVVVVGVDHLGQGETYDFPVIVDLTPPVSNPSVVGPRYRDGPGDVWNYTAAAVVTLAAMDPGRFPVGLANISYRFDGGPWVRYAAPFSLAGLEDGPHVLGVRSVDHLGNTETERTTAFQVDTTPPVTEDWYSRREVGGLLLELDASDALSGVEVTWVSVDGGEPFRYERPLAFVDPGRHEVRFWSLDRLGNEEAPRTATIVVPNWKPVVALVFAIVLAIVGVFAVRRWPVPESSPPRTWARVVLPWVVAEALTGVASLFTAVLAIPPLLGIGLVVDVVILSLGLLLPCLQLWRSTRDRMPAGEPPEPSP